MTITRAMYTGVTGLAAEGETLSVLGDNIANVNTVGFKSQRALFEDVLGYSLTSGNSGSQAGAGVRVSDIEQMFTQGALSTTGVSTDVALTGDGFFVVSGSVEGMVSDFYTRAGQFRVNESGLLVNPEGLKVQGYPANPDGTFAAAVGDLKLNLATLPAQPTSSASITANFDAGSSIPTVAWDPQNPELTANSQTSITVYDSLGTAHSLSVYFRKTAPNTWDYHVLAKGSEVSGGTAGQNLEVGSGSIGFTTDGALDTVTSSTPTSVSFIGAQPNQAISWDLGSPISGGGSGLTGCTQYSSASQVSAQSQNGYSAGEASGLSIDGNGLVRASYTNGQQQAIGTLAIAKFRSNEGLGRAGQNLWIATKDSGSAALGTAGSGGRGSVSSGALEQSNVDLAGQFVGLIQHQRAFQADSKTIQAADEMLQELVNLKR